MIFYDKVKIFVESWKWWDWITSWRREARVPYWWPSGGDWWKWWDIIIQSTNNENTLLKYKYKKNHKAEDGKRGKSKDMAWKSWWDLKLTVPVWTVIKESTSWKILCELTKDWQSLNLLKWGLGGWWNIHFKTSTNQYPDFSLFWEPGKSKEIILEIQLLWDVSLIWFPSTGKSTIINSISNSKAKIADYPFTTIIPNLGMVKQHEKDFCVVDVPWLIKWASSWKWLWFQFLRHILKSTIWFFVLDLSEDIKKVDQFDILLQEIFNYLDLKSFEDGWFIQKNIVEKKYEFNINEQLIKFQFILVDDEGKKYVVLEKYLLILLNKSDLLSSDYINQQKELIIKSVQKKINLKDKNVIQNNMLIWSWITKEWLQELKQKCYNILFEKWKKHQLDVLYEDIVYNEINQDNYVSNITELELPNLIQQWYISSDFVGNVREVYYSDFVYYCYVLPWWNNQAEMRFWQKMQKKWVLWYFEGKWIKRWDILKVMNNYNLDPLFIKYE